MNKIKRVTTEFPVYHSIYYEDPAIVKSSYRTIIYKRNCLGEWKVFKEYWLIYTVGRTIGIQEHQQFGLPMSVSKEKGEIAITGWRYYDYPPIRSLKSTIPSLHYFI